MLSAAGPPSRPPDRPYHLDREIIRDDLTRELPKWILSSYGPGRQAPLQLFGGYPREQSFEEIRLRHYQLAAASQQQQAIQEAQGLVADANQQIQTALKDLDGAIKYIIIGEQQHPNRIDICEAKGAVLPENIPAVPAPGLGQQPALGPPSIQPTFGQPSSLPQNPFAKPGAGALANKPVPAFGNPPTTFGQPTPLNPFAQKANPAQTQPTPSNPFATAQPLRNPFAPAQQPPANSFPTAQAQPPSNPFAPAAPRNPFDTAQLPAPTQLLLPTPPIFNPSTSTPSGPAPPSTPQNTRKDPNDRYTLWRGKPITYIDNEPCFKRPDGNWERVWFPEGVPSWTKEPEVPEGYWTREAEEEYAWAREHGSWKEGRMPEVMPKAGWTSWDF